MLDIAEKQWQSFPPYFENLTPNTLLSLMNEGVFTDENWNDVRNLADSLLKHHNKLQQTVSAFQKHPSFVLLKKTTQQLLVALPIVSADPNPDFPEDFIAFQVGTLPLQLRDSLSRPQRPRFRDCMLPTIVLHQLVTSPTVDTAIVSGNQGERHTELMVSFTEGGTTTTAFCGFDNNRSYTLWSTLLGLNTPTYQSKVDQNRIVEIFNSRSGKNDLALLDRFTVTRIAYNYAPQTFPLIAKRFLDLYSDRPEQPHVHYVQGLLAKSLSRTR